jgi:hypothetical protein
VVPAKSQVEAKRQSSVRNDGSVISRAEAVMNARPAMCDELKREHAEVRTCVIEEPALAWLVGDEVAAGVCTADERRR